MIVTFLRDLFGGCREAPSDSREAVGEVKNGNKRSDKYDSDVKALKERYRVEFETGVCIKRREVKHLIIRYLTSLFGVGHLGLETCLVETHRLRCLLSAQPVQTY